MVSCPICSKAVNGAQINAHLDSGCETHLLVDDNFHAGANTAVKKGGVSDFFRVPRSPSASTATELVRRREEEHDTIGSGPHHLDAAAAIGEEEDAQQAEQVESDGYFNENRAGDVPGDGPGTQVDGSSGDAHARQGPNTNVMAGQKRSAGVLSSPIQLDPGEAPQAESSKDHQASARDTPIVNDHYKTPAKRAKPASALYRAQPLAERMRPGTLDEVLGQDLVGPTGVLRSLILTDKIPSLIFWGAAGTGKTTIARLMAQQTGARFVEINSTSTGVAELKKLFGEARADLAGVAGRKTVIFCDEIHRFSRSQQDVFLGPVEAGTITLVGATTENPSFKVQSALLSRCRVFTLQKLELADIERILERAVEREGVSYGIDRNLVDQEMVRYLAAFAEGDARTGLNLLELAMDLSSRPDASKDGIKASLTKTLVYDRAGDQHYDTISAFHKSLRGSDPHAALYYLARMIQSGEDPLFIARRMVVVASEDVGLADNSLLTLATSTYAAAEKIGMPEARINLAHCTVALALARKSTRAYRGLENAVTALKTPGIAGLPIPLHLRNAPTRLMKEMGYGKEYKYNPNFVQGKVKQDYLPEELQGSVFLEDVDLGTQVDEELSGEE